MALRRLWTVWACLLVACGSQQSEEPSLATSSAGPVAADDQQVDPGPTTHPPTAASVPAPPENGSDEGNTPGPTITLACNRASIQIPSRFSVNAEYTSPCLNPGYPFAMEGHGFAGGDSEHTLNAGGCEIELRAGELVGIEPPESPTVERVSDYLRIRIKTADETLMEIVVDGCSEAARTSVSEMLVRSFESEPLESSRNEVQAQLSTRGHGISLSVPESYMLVSLGGSADQFETAYGLFGPGETTATMYTAWHETADPAAPLQNFQPRVLPRRIRQAQMYDPIQDVMCRSVALVGPEPRIDSWLTLCGPNAGDAALLQILRSARFSRPPE